MRREGGTSRPCAESADRVTRSEDASGGRCSARARSPARRSAPHCRPVSGLRCRSKHPVPARARRTAFHAGRPPTPRGRVSGPQRFDRAPQAAGLASASAPRAQREVPRRTRQPRVPDQSEGVAVSGVHAVAHEELTEAVAVRVADAPPWHHVRARRECREGRPSHRPLRSRSPSGASGRPPRPGPLARRGRRGAAHERRLGWERAGAPCSRTSPPRLPSVAPFDPGEIPCPIRTTRRPSP